MNTWHKISIALLLISTLAAAEPACDSSGRREDCSKQDTYPCQWSESSCEFQYGELTFTCSDVPRDADVSVTCTPSDATKEYSVRILDTQDYRKYWYWKPDYHCVNRDCRNWITGTFSWQSASSSRYEHLRQAARSSDDEGADDDDGGHYGEPGDDGADDDDGGSYARPHDPPVESFSGGDMEYRVVVSMRDHDTCLDISCDVVFSEPGV